MSSIRGLPESWTYKSQTAKVEVRSLSLLHAWRSSCTSSIAMRHHSHMTNGERGLSSRL